MLLLLSSLPPLSAFPGQGDPLSFHLFCALLSLFGVTAVFGHVPNSPLKALCKCSSSETPCLPPLRPLVSHLFVWTNAHRGLGFSSGLHDHLSHTTALPPSSREGDRGGDFHLQTACHLPDTMLVSYMGRPFSTPVYFRGRHCHTHFTGEICQMKAESYN